MEHYVTRGQVMDAAAIMQANDRAAAPRAKSTRDPRVDVMRGLALLMIFVDHIPGDDLNHFTLRNFGFSDAAEVFVLLSGFACMMAYGGTFDRQGALAGLRRIALRCLRLYVFQVGMLLGTLAFVVAWTTRFHMAPKAMAPVIDRGFSGVFDVLTLRAQPSDLNILPLYIVLLVMFPPFYALMRLSPWIAISASVALWGAANLYPQLNLINTIDGQGWFFNPFAWQLLFALGACLAVLMRRGDLPRGRWLVAVCWLFLIGSFFEAAPWQDWGLPNLTPFPIAPPDKTNLALLRLLHVSAIMYLVLSWPRLVTVMRMPGVAPIMAAVEACGKHSLEVFALGTMLGVSCRLILRTYGATAPMQFAVNAVGIGAMLCLGLVLEHRPFAIRSQFGPPRPVGRS